ncbi:MAG: D-alanine--D-alanine ligase, partial [Thermodesulfobacteriota bacterium]
MSKKVVGIIFGGRSVEHEISLLSAKSIIKNIDNKKYQIFPIFIQKDGAWRKASIESWINDGELIIS